MKEDLTILHISDLHTGKDFGFDETSYFLSAFKKAIRQIKEEYSDFSPKFIFCTGDITSIGSHLEMENAVELIKNITNITNVELSQTIVSIGNHDIDWNENAKNLEMIQRIVLKKWQISLIQ